MRMIAGARCQQRILSRAGEEHWDRTGSLDEDEKAWRLRTLDA